MGIDLCSKGGREKNPAILFIATMGQQLETLRIAGQRNGTK